jgi:hypothetical protein
MSRPQQPFKASRAHTRTSSRNRNAIKPAASLCKFPFADGRRCRMLRYPGHPHLCLFHARAELQQLEAARLGTELGQTLTGDFTTATDINHALGRLYTAIAQGRIPARTAATMAYVGQLLLQSVNGVKSEFKFSYNFDQWYKMQQGAKPLSPAPTFAPPTEPRVVAGLQPALRNEGTSDLNSSDAPCDELLTVESAAEKEKC